MKKIISLILIGAAILLGFTACEKIINKTPEMVLSQEAALTTQSGLEAALNGLFNSLQSGQIYGGNIWAGQDMLANNVKPSGQGNIVYEETQMLNKSMSPDNLISCSFWQDCYYSINMANTILEAMPNISMSDADYNRIRGECLFVRSILYFEMVRFLGNSLVDPALGVPLVTAPTGIDGKPARATVEEVYTQIFQDLDEAAQILPESSAHLVTKLTAKALLSRVYFYHGDYQQCVDVSNDVINSGKFQLTDSIMDNFHSVVTSEIIFAILSTQTNTTSGMLMGYYRLESNGKFSPSPGVLKVFTFTGGLQDQRYRDFFKVSNTKYFVTLFDDRYMNIPVIRLAEIFLNRGEAFYNLGDQASALRDLNMVRKRAGITDTLQVNATLFYYERSKELAFQGDNFFNQKRLQKEKISDYELPWNSERLLYLVPQRELDVNENLVQN
jgi:hypothetical protein